MSSSDAIQSVSNFLLDAPPGELQDVISDVKALIGDDASVVAELNPALEKYNKAQLISTLLPGGDRLVIVSDYNDLGGGRFYDVESKSSFAFDHVSQKAFDVQSYILESKNAELITSLLKSLGPHVSEHYPSLPAYGVYPSSEDTTIALVITGNKYSPANYWNGRWRSIYTFDPASNALSGEIKVDVHYYEDGNVRLLTTHAIEEEISSGNAADVVRTIARKEKEYQENLNDAFVQLSEGAFKSLRRQLPITRQKIDWDKIGSYRLGQQVGLFPTHEHS